MSQTVSDELLKHLKYIGVKRIYGIPGDTIDTLMESLRADKDVDFIVCRHEENAAFMASGEARITGKLAVVVACQGPGANHLINGLADAQSDGVPVLAITGQVNSASIGTGMPQESSQLSLLDEVTVFNAEARNVENLLNLLHIAINEAVSKRGVAHISIPSDVMQQHAIDYPLPNLPALLSNSELQPSNDSILTAAKALNEHKKVAILYGDGARGQAQTLLDLAEKLQAPLIHTTRSKDILPTDNPHVMGGIGIMGGHTANHALQGCDLLLIVGCNYAWKTFYPRAKKIKIDHNPTNLTGHIYIDMPIYGSTKPSLNALLKHTNPKQDDSFLKSAKYSATKYIDQLNFDILASRKNKRLHPAEVVKSISASMSEDAQLFGDSGSTTIWVNNVAQFNGKQRFIWSANLATLGGALPQAIGGILAEPNKQTLVVAGDGGFQMSIADLVTAAMYQLPIKCFILNNSSYWFIENEEATHDGNVAAGTKLLNPDYEKLAEACHCKGLTIRNASELDSKLQEAFNHDGPVVVNCLIDPNIMLIPPALTKDMVKHYLKSEIKSWFTAPSDDEKRLTEFSKQFEL